MHFSDPVPLSCSRSSPPDGSSLPYTKCEGGAHHSQMSARGQIATSRPAAVRSALPPRADSPGTPPNVTEGPEPDLRRNAEFESSRSLTPQRTDAMVASKMGAVAWAARQHPVSHHVRRCRPHQPSVCSAPQCGRCAALPGTPGCRHLHTFAPCRQNAAGGAGQ